MTATKKKLNFAGDVVSSLSGFINRVVLGTRRTALLNVLFVAAFTSLKVVAIIGLVSISAIAEKTISDGAESKLPRGQTRPNIILLLTDDQRADTLSIEGHSRVRTPNIDDLARSGVRFKNAFTVQPICAASRFAFFSGQYERTSGLGFNSPYEVNAAQWSNTYPALLREAGYYSGFIGKYGVQYYNLGRGIETQFDYWRGHDGWLPFFPKDLPENPSTAIYQSSKHDIVTEIMGELIADFLDRRPRHQPFLLSVSFSAPHNSIVSTMHPEGASPDCNSYACRVMGYPSNSNPRLRGHPIYDELYRQPPPEPSADTGRDPFRFIPEGVIDHEARMKWYAYNYETTLQPEHLVRYYQTVSGIDKVIGDLRALLGAEGLEDNTVIIFSSDHGLLNGEYGTGGKALLYDLVAKIPLIIYDPRAAFADAGSTNKELVLNIDVPATIIALAGLETPNTMEGRSLLAQETPRQEVFLESLTVAEGNPFIEATRTQHWKYVRYFAARACPYREDDLDFTKSEPIFEQLFDLRNDPEERRNLASSSDHQNVLAHLQKRTSQHSQYRTNAGRRYKLATPVSHRPEDGVYCW